MRHVEQEDNLIQMELSQDRVLAATKDTTFMHTVQAWSLLDHSKSALGFRQNGITNSLSGADDHDLTQEAMSLWAALSMADLRTILVQEVEEAFQRGELRSWADAKTLIAPYDDHPALREGMEDAGVETDTDGEGDGGGDGEDS